MPQRGVPDAQLILSKATAKVAEHGGPGSGKEFLTSKRKAKVWYAWIVAVLRCGHFESITGYSITT